MRLRSWAAGCAMLLVLCGCAEQQEAEPQLETIGQLGAAYLDAGGTCEDLVEQYRDDEEAPAVATCGEDTVLTLASDADQAAQLAVAYRLRDVPVLLGGTWLIQDPDIADLQESLGGDIVTLEAADGPANLADALLVGAEGPIERDGVAADGLPEQVDVDGTVITVVVDPTCDYCSTFLETNEDELARLAASGEATIAYLPVALDDSIENAFASSVGVNALACTADADPEAFLGVLDGLLASADDNGWTPDDLAEVGDAAGVDIADCAAEGTFAYWTRQATSRALSEPLPDGEPLRGVPSVLVGDALFAGDVADPDAFAAFVAEQG